jgi:steroid delta-isomerase-like uncharacterized protein
MPAMQPRRLLQTYYDAFNAGDVDGMLGCMTDDVVHHVNQGGTRHGKPAFRAFCAHLHRCFREQLEDIVIMVAADGSRASAEFTIRGNYIAADPGLPPARGQGYTLAGGSFFVIREERIARLTVYYNLNDWIAQVSR